MHLFYFEQRVDACDVFTLFTPLHKINKTCLCKKGIWHPDTLLDALFTLAA